MLISPPFLPERQANQGDEAWLAAAMPEPPSRVAGTGAPEGSFPLSHQLSWHNGVHIQAPVAAGAALPARAIADGTVVFAQAPTAVNNDVEHPQNYNTFDRAGTRTAAWSGDGCVIIEHSTSIGADNATETAVVFYSVYMHLSALARTTPAGETVARPWQAGDPIRRKQPVGTPGQIYGHSGQIHFEICVDADNLRRLIGRAPAWTDPAAIPVPSADGRTDCIFGSLYVYLPANTPVHAGATMPTAHLRAEANAPAATTLGTALWVKMTYGNGACTVSSYDSQGVRRGPLAAQANADDALPAQPNAEYELYASAVQRHDALTPTQRAASSISGWYELLRFGRNIGRGTGDGDRDSLPANAAHWRRIPGADGQAVWADLNAAGSFKFSDADFPAVAGWNFIDDDTNAADQRCDSERLKTLIQDPDSANTARRQPDQLARRLSDPDVKKKLSKLLCRFPSEWDRSTAAARYGFVSTTPPFVEAPDNLPRLFAHLQAMSFSGLPQGYLDAQWHVHPRSFIALWRRNVWFSRGELARIYPDAKYPVRALATEGQGRTPETIREMYRQVINLALRKYQIDTPARLAHFFGQGAVESMHLVLMMEGSAAYSRNPAHASFQPETNGFYVPSRPNDYLYYLENRLGNIAPGDGPKFRGRGMKQLTGRENYSKYWVFRGWLQSDSFQAPWWNPARPARAPDIPDPQRLSAVPYNAIDAGGWYWEAGAASNRFQSINSIIVNDVIDRATVRAVARAINGVNRQTGEPNALTERLAETLAVQPILMDEP